MGLFLLLQQLIYSTSHDHWKSLFFKRGLWRKYILSAACSSLYERALMTGLMNSRIPNTFISASTKKGNDGQILSSQITLAKQLSERHGNMAFYISFKVFGNVTCNFKDSNLVNILNRWFFFFKDWKAVTISAYFIFQWFQINCYLSNLINLCCPRLESGYTEHTVMF